MQWVHHVYQSAGAVDAFRAVMTNASGKIDDTLLDVQTANITDITYGDWTPILAFGGSTSGITYTVQAGSYITIGNLVFVTCQIALSAKGSSTGAATISGLPFTSGNNNKYRAAFALRAQGMTLTGDIIPNAYINGNSAEIAFTVVDSGAGSNMTDAHFGATTLMFVSGCYHRVTI